MLWGLVAAPQQAAELAAFALENGISCSAEGETLWACGSAAQRQAMAEELAVRFYGCWQDQLLYELAERMFSHRGSEQLQEIAAAAAHLARDEAPRHQQHDLAAQCLSFWQHQPRLHLGGLVRFCLPGYGTRLRSWLYEAADLQLLRQEDEEYWQLLAAHLAQARGGAELHLFCTGSDFRLCMAAPRGWRCLEGGRLCGFEDLLLLNLLRLPPQKLLLHGNLPPKMQKMISKVFGTRAAVAEE